MNVDTLHSIEQLNVCPLVADVLCREEELSRVVRRMAGDARSSDILSKLREPVQCLIADVSVLLRKRLSVLEYDILLDTVGRWDSFFSYHNQELTPYLLPADKNLYARNVARLSGKRFIIGTVVSCAMQKTMVVTRERTVPHRPTGKRIVRTTRFFVHDEDEVCRIGDLVIAEETRPMSKKKHHKLFRRVVF